jgi:hypothetical protein
VPNLAEFAGIVVGALVALNILLFVVLYLMLPSQDLSDMTEKYGSWIKWIDIGVLAVVGLSWFSASRRARLENEDHTGTDKTGEQTNTDDK